MTTRAVTSASSAGATIDSEHEPASHFLPSDEHYRLTGEMPDEEPEVAGRQRRDDSGSTKEQQTEASASEKETQSEKEEASAASSEADTAAASAAATTQEKKGPATTKTPQTSESRHARLARENRELRERVAKLEKRPSDQQQRETQQVSQPATEAKTTAEANPRPKIDDVDPKTQKPKYATYADYETAKDEWNRKEAVREFQETHSKTERERQQTEAERIIERTVNERVQATRKIHADYDDVTSSALSLKDEHGQDALFWVKGSPVDGFFLDSERGHEVLYHVAKNFDACKHIFARDPQGKYLLNPIRQLRELSKIEAALEAPAAKTTPTTPVKPISQAPRPPHQTSGKGSVSKDTVAQATEDGDSETYIREQNNRDPRVQAILASRKGK